MLFLGKKERTLLYASVFLPKGRDLLFPFLAFSQQSQHSLNFYILPLLPSSFQTFSDFPQSARGTRPTGGQRDLELNFWASPQCEEQPNILPQKRGKERGSIPIFRKPGIFGEFMRCLLLYPRGPSIFFLPCAAVSYGIPSISPVQFRIVAQPSLI